jgi:arabinose-5-phosphate isomerase
VLGRRAAVRASRKARAYNRPILKDTRRRTLPAKPSFDAQRALALAHQTFDIEAQALLGLKARQGEHFARACEAMLACTGRVVVMGMGKSGHVGRKIAATLASTGTPAMFVHPAEASHGDLGMVTGGDVVLAISNSGEVDELAAILPALKRLGVPLIAMTGRSESTLAQHADIVLSSAVDQEACPMNLAPTASTTAQMALGDALAVALLDARGFREEDFARSHPGGSLGRKLLTHVHDLMRTGDALPTIGPDTGFTDMMREMSAKGLGAAAVVDEQGRVLGIFTDGDLRRHIEQGRDLRALKAGEVMHRTPRTVHPDALAVDAADLMEEARITLVLVVDADRRLVGALNSNDLMRAKVI